MTETQRLRWWQDEEPGQAAQKAVERVALAPTPLLPGTIYLPVETAKHSGKEHENDTWAELESEARRRSPQSIAEETESVSFYIDKTAALIRYHRYFRIWSRIMGASFLFLLLCTSVVVWYLYGLLPRHIHFSPFVLLSPYIGLFIGYLPSLPMLLSVRRRGRWLQNSDEPAVRLSPQGIHLYTPDYKNTVLPWGDIVSVKPKSSGKYRYLELSSTKRRKFVVSELYLPCSAEVLAARIATYKADRCQISDDPKRFGRAGQKA